MQLYVLPTCPYCIRVLDFLKGTDIPVEIIEVPRDHAQRTQVKEVSGQTYVPVLVDGDTLIADDDEAIIKHLSTKELPSSA